MLICNLDCMYIRIQKWKLNMNKDLPVHMLQNTMMLLTNNYFNYNQLLLYTKIKIKYYGEMED